MYKITIEDLETGKIEICETVKCIFAGTCNDDIKGMGIVADSNSYKENYVAVQCALATADDQLRKIPAQVQEDLNRNYSWMYDETPKTIRVTQNLKTEQEQIEAMAKATAACAIVNGHCVDCWLYEKSLCPVYDYAKHLQKQGYGDISEYKAKIAFLFKEVDRLRIDNDDWSDRYREYYDLFNRADTAYKELKSQVKQQIKEAQIDVLNKAKDRLIQGRVSNDNVAINANIEIGKLIKEVQNAEDKG
nr:MAG TPA: hypothetical protein [Caudoviricetes sp.]